MSRLLKVVCLLVLLFGPISLFAEEHPVNAAGNSGITVIVDGNEMKLSVKPIKVKGNVYLHAKSIFNALEIQSTLGKKTIKIIHNDNTYRGEVDQKRMYIGERKLNLTVPPLLREGRIYVPLRFVEIVSGKGVKYDASNSQISIGLSPESKKALQRSLFEAARRGDATAVTNLIKRGADPNGKLNFEYGNNIPLVYAVSNNRTEAARALVKAGAKVDSDSQHLGFSVIVSQNAELLEILIENGLDPNYKNHTGTLLQSASGIIGMSENGNFRKDLRPSLEIVNMLLKHGADPGIDNPLYRAVDAQNYSIIQSLLRAGADPYKANEHGETPYEYSVRKNINRWLTLQAERVILPSFKILDANGAEVSSGGVGIRSLDDSKTPYHYIQFNSGQVYIDVPDGRYQIVHVYVPYSAYILQQTYAITIKDGNVVPNTVTLPRLNVKVTLTSDSIPISDGFLSLYNERTSSPMAVEVQGNQATLFAEPGQYRIFSYVDSSNKSYNVDSYLTVKGNSGIEEITFDLREKERNDSNFYSSNITKQTPLVDMKFTASDSW
ncbi:stalk domain-containing protein [Paenibacillus sp. EC2-1]|uniref:stalk domain-containing protein n=1 Tax=Paenibacillus sp. EC2-1 TaxID=3388665 RepID=UPI003BEF3826